MEVPTMVGMAFGMCMDCFAISLGKGLALKDLKVKYALIVAAWMGSFHFLMPLIGSAIGSAIYDFISPFIEWIVFAVMVFLGGKLIIEASRDEKDEINENISFRVMLPISIAASIDALAVGVTFSSAGENILIGSVILGAIAAFMAFIGTYIGNRTGQRFGRYVVFAGGIILITIGILAVLEGQGIL